MAKKELDWSPKVELGEGLKYTIAYFDDLLKKEPYAFGEIR
jgi:UDP-glucuronate decarboxylase